MTYDMLEQQIKSLPHEYYIQVENFVHFMVAQVEKQSQKKDTSDPVSALKLAYHWSSMCSSTLHWASFGICK